MKFLKTLLSTMLVAAILVSMVLTANAYTYKGTGDAETKAAGSAGETYVFDWTNSDGSYVDISKITGHQSLGVYAHSERNNRHRFSFQPNSSYTVKQVDGVFKAGVYNDMYIVDDFSLGCTDNRFKAEAGHYYEITVEWTTWNAGSLYLVQNYGGSTDFSGHTVGVPADIIKGSDTKTVVASDAMQYTTYWVDADKKYDILDTTGQATTHIPAGRYFGLGAVDNAQYQIYSVTVTVYNKEAFELGSENGVTVNFDAGFKDIYLPHGDGQNVGTIEIADDPNNTGRGNALKITTKRKDGTTFTFGLPVAPGLGTFKSKADNYLPGVDGFKVKAGNKYRVSFEIYLEKSDEGIGASYPCYVASNAGVGQTGNKTTVGTKANTSGLTSTEMTKYAGDGVWRKYEFTFTAPSTAGHEYLLLGIAHPGDTDGDGEVATVYFDNIVVADVTDAPSSFATEVKRSIRAESGSGDNYVSAGLRFRGEIPTATAAAAAEVGFIAAPDAYIAAYEGATAWYDMATGAPALDKALAANATDKVYGVNGDNNQYQLIITKLTKENEAKSLKGVYFTVVMYVKAANGSYTYYYVGRSSYNEVNNVYMNNDVEF